MKKFNELRGEKKLKMKESKKNNANMCSRIGAAVLMDIN